jgi:hypothetical protein
MRRSREHPQLSSSETTDLWEHACLLYHSYEWQSAVGAFSELGRCTSDLGDKRIFALNKGLIEARLGDFEVALGSFANALAFEENSPITHFLLGLVYAELGNYDKGQTHFEHCMGCLDTQTQDHWTRIGPFGLYRLAIEDNINRLRSVAVARAAGSGQMKPARICLHTIPANVIFEPPSRSGHASQENGRSSSGSTCKAELPNDCDEHLREPISRATHPTEVLGPGINSLHLIKDADMNLTTAPTNDTIDDRKKHKRLMPRDAQVRDGSMRELAQFLRHAGPSESADVTVDRSYMQRLLQGNTGGQQALDFLSRASTTSSATSLLGCVKLPAKSRLRLLQRPIQLLLIPEGHQDHDGQLWRKHSVGFARKSVRHGRTNLQTLSRQMVSDRVINPTAPCRTMIGMCNHCPALYPRPRCSLLESRGEIKDQTHNGDLLSILRQAQLRPLLVAP